MTVEKQTKRMTATSDSSFNQNFDRHGSWRREFALRLKLLVEWLKENSLLSVAVEERLIQLESRVRNDKLMVAFVAEYSRGKSELINAMFFADYGRRIMPASAGRTTMCPTEIAYEAGVGTCLRLLPIETRLEGKALGDWRPDVPAWQRFELDASNPEQMAKVLAMVSETVKVDQDRARALGFWHDDEPDDNPLKGQDGKIEIPRWRHALINIAHPLLRQGLVVLDTPGLNALGAEPELTVSLLPQAHAVVFILGADTGVTRSDMAIWRDHLSMEAQHTDSRLVALNKIDMLWDELSTPDQIKAQIERQQADVAQILSISPSKVIPVSAQKGLVAKVNKDDTLLRASCLVDIERALADGVIGQRQQILQAALDAAIDELKGEADRMIHVRLRDVSEQMQELKGLEGKNVAVVKHMRARVEIERTEFEQSDARIQAVKSVHIKLLRDVFRQLSGKTLSFELTDLTTALAKTGLKLGAKKAYSETFGRLRSGLVRSQEGVADIRSMLDASFRQLNAEYGFSLNVPPELDLFRFSKDLDLIERNHNQYMSLGKSLQMVSSDTSTRLVRALKSRLRIVYESALAELELWSKLATSQMESQLAERRQNFTKRLDAMDRVQRAETGLHERLSEVGVQQAAILQQQTKLSELCATLIHRGSSQSGLATPTDDREQADESDELCDVQLDVVIGSTFTSESLPAYLQ